MSKGKPYYVPLLIPVGQAVLLLELLQKIKLEQPGPGVQEAMASLRENIATAIMSTRQVLNEGNANGNT